MTYTETLCENKCINVLLLCTKIVSQKSETKVAESDVTKNTCTEEIVRQ